MAETEQLEDLVPEIDRDFLTEKIAKFGVAKSGNDVLVIIHDFEFPDAYAPRTADLMIILPAGYPNANLDMFWTTPDVKLKNGSWPDRATERGTYNNINWQRWSRHFPQQWRQGVDNLRTFVTTIRRELARGV